MQMCFTLWSYGDTTQRLQQEVGNLLTIVSSFSDVQTDSFRIDNENAWNESFKILQEENTPTLEEVVEKVIEMSNSDTVECAQDSPEDSTEVAEDMDTEETSAEPESVEPQTEGEK